ncbi:MAG: GNAT family N-acetyltransferase [Pirellulales bacterium]
MSLTYFKRYRMEIDLAARPIRAARLASGYIFVPWRAELLEAHAEMKYQSFRGEIDASVFPCLASYEGCLRLMDQIAGKPRFVPEATWLVATCDVRQRPRSFCGTIQGMRDAAGFGAIQNVGITADHRGLGLGAALVAQSLAGFRQVGVRRVFLEVTAQNEGAVRLYDRIGFSKARTNYRAVEVAYS